MKVLFDLTYIPEDNPTIGVANFAYSLLKGFKSVQGISIIPLFSSRNRDTVSEIIGEYQETATIRILTNHSFPYIAGPFSHRRLERAAERLKADIFFCPFISDRSLYVMGLPSAGVIHDTQGFTVQANTARKVLYSFFARRNAGHFSRIATISASSGKLIENAFRGHLKSAPQVIHNSIGYTAKPHIESKEKFILSVNTVLEYKNPLTIIKALELLKDRIPHKLILKGRSTGYWDKTLLPYIRSHAMEDRVILDETDMTKEQLSELYASADLFITASTMEGFGLTPIEAALHHTPVICSDIPALRESSRNLLNYYSPIQSAGALADRIIEVLDRGRDELDDIAATLEKEYSPDRQAAAYVAFFNEIAKT